MEPDRQREYELGALIRERRKSLDMKQDQLAELVTVAAGKGLSQSKVSDHENGHWARGAIETYLLAYSEVLQLPRLLEIVGWRKPGETPEPLTLEDLVRADPSLDERSKEHLVAQYALLQAATRQNRGGSSAATG